MAVMPNLGWVDEVVTDPPYGLNFPYLSHDDTRDALVALINAAMPEIFRLSRSSYILCGPTQINLYPQTKWVCCVTWNTTGSFGAYGYNQWTPVLCYGDDLKGFGNVNGVTKADTLRISGGGGVGFNRTEHEAEHTCPKPINMMKLVINRFTTRGGTVLDPFMGSGSTGVASVSMGRRFIGVEKDPQYFELARRRIEQELSQGELFSS